MEFPATARTADKCLAQGAYRYVEVAVAGATGSLGGFASGRQPASHRMPAWTCASKALLAIGVARLVGRGDLAFADRVVRYVPELDAAGWRDVCLSDLLSHSVALSHDVAAWSVFLDDPWVLEKVRAVTPGPAGATGVYLRWTNSFLIGQVIERVTGDSCEVFIDKELAQPLGLDDTLLRYPEDDRIDVLADAARSIAGDAATGLRVRPNHFWPGMSATGPPADLARALGSLLPGADQLGIPPWVIAAVTSVHNRNGGGIAGHDLSWGLGVVVDNRIASPRFSAGTFGHFGHDGGVVGFADPEPGVAIALRLRGVTGHGLAVALRRSAMVDAVLADLRAAGLDAADLGSGRHGDPG